MAEVSRADFNGMTGAYFTQDERTVSSLLAFHELVRSKPQGQNMMNLSTATGYSPQSHSLTHTRDNEGVRNRQQRQVLIEREILRVQEHNRLVG